MVSAHVYADGWEGVQVREHGCRCCLRIPNCSFGQWRFIECYLLARSYKLRILENEWCRKLTDYQGAQALNQGLNLLVIHRCRKGSKGEPKPWDDVPAEPDPFSQGGSQKAPSRECRVSRHETVKGEKGMLFHTAYAKAVGQHEDGLYKFFFKFVRNNWHCHSISSKYTEWWFELHIL